MANLNGDTTTVPSSTWHALLRGFASATSRLGLSHRLGSTHEGARDIEEVLGYKDHLTYKDFKRAYERYDLAQRLVNAFPDATWGQSPLLREGGDPHPLTPFEQGWDDLAQRLHIFRHLARADRLANLGHFAIVLIGLANQKDLAQPAAPVRRPEDVVYLLPYSEEFATVERFGTDTSDASYAQPVLYRLATQGGTTGGSLKEPPRIGTLVHASRVLHIPGELHLDDEVYGLPILEAVYNKLVDLLKVVGGSAEMFWLDAKRRLAVQLREGYTLGADDEVKLNAELDEYRHGLRDILRLMGADVTNLSGTVASPKEHFEVLMQSIAGTRGIPMRILLGSEMGNLASTQDEEAWLRSVGRRQANYAQEYCLLPLVNRLITLGALPEPANQPVPQWPNIWALSEMKQAAVTKDRAAAIRDVLAGIASYAGPAMGDTVIAPEELRPLLATVWQASELELPEEMPAELIPVDTAPAPAEL